MLFEVQKSDGDFVGLFSCNVGRNDQFVLRHIFLSKVLPIIDDCTNATVNEGNKNLHFTRRIGTIKQYIFPFEVLFCI